MQIPEFKVPPWLSDQDAATIQKRMMERLPADISNIEGDFPWDLTMPSALEKSELLQFFAIELLKQMFPMWATGDFLTYHASGDGLKPKAANRASGAVTVTGVAGTAIPTGFALAVPAVGNAPAVEFRTTGSAVIPEAGSVTVAIEAAIAGTGGNVPAGTVSIMVTPLKGVTALKNGAATTGGTPEEDEEALRQRILEADANIDISYVGCDADYVRWAKEVDGVGEAMTMANWEEAVPNSVKLVVLDANGQPANERILTAVYDHIMVPGNPGERKAPVGAILTVAAPTARTINYTVTLVLSDESALERVKDDFGKALLDYYAKAKEEKVVRYSQVAAQLAAVPGVMDFEDLTMNGGSGNIVLVEDEYPVTGTITATAAPMAEVGT